MDFYKVDQFLNVTPVSAPQAPEVEAVPVRMTAEAWEKKGDNYLAEALEEKDPIQQNYLLKCGNNCYERMDEMHKETKAKAEALERRIGQG